MRRVLAAIAIGALFTPIAEAQTLADAFERERAHLEAERSALASEVERFDARAEADVRSATARVSAVRAELNAVRDRLAAAAAVETRRANGDVESALAAHAAHAERMLGITPIGGSSVLDRARLGLSGALDRLEAGARVVESDGEFFLPDGRRGSGRVLQLGAVGRATKLDGGLTPLVAVSNGAYEARPDRAVPDGGLVPVVIAGEEGIERSAARSLVDTLRAGGRVLAAGLGERTRGVEAVDDALSEALIRESAGFHRFLPVIRVIAAVSPLLGLLGTVTGMISTFDTITTFGTGDPKLLSGGISEALITTELGLIVAIPFLFVHNILAGRVHRNVSELEERGLALSRVLANGEDK